jgi:hypothetical protein
LSTKQKARERNRTTQTGQRREKRKESWCTIGSRSRRMWRSINQKPDITYRSTNSCIRTQTIRIWALETKAIQMPRARALSINTINHLSIGLDIIIIHTLTATPKFLNLYIIFNGMYTLITHTIPIVMSNAFNSGYRGTWLSY